MEIQTKRLWLRKYKAQDKSDFVALFTNEKVMKHVDTGIFSRAKAEKLWKKILRNDLKLTHKIWAVTKKENGRFLGHALINRRPSNKKEWELGYILSEKNWGNGFATEIAKALVKYSFDHLDLKEVFGTVDDDHFESIKVLKKASMKFFKHEFDSQGRFSVYRIRKD